MTTKRRPAPLVVGRVRVRVIRGPRADGRFYWRARRFADCAETTVWVGWATPAEAEREVSAVVAEVAKPGRSAGVRTMFDLLDAWAASIEDRADLVAQTRAVHIDTANRITGSALPLVDVALERVDRRSLEAYRDGRIRQGAARSTVRLELVALRVAWRWGRETGAAPDRDLPPVSIKVGAVDRHVPTAATIAAVLADLEAHAPPWCARAFRLLAATGARRAEVAALTWGDVEIDTKEGRVVRGVMRVNGKTGPRRVPVHRSVAELVARWRPAEVDPAAPVLGVGVGTVCAMLLTKVHESCDRLGVRWFRLHDVRASVVGTLYRAGVDPGVAAAIAGHSPATALEYYRRATDEDMRAAAERAALGVFGGVAEDEPEHEEIAPPRAATRRTRPAQTTGTTKRSHRS